MEQIPAWLQAIATVVLVGVTAWYVRLTRQVVEETRRTRERQAIPFVSVSPVGGTRDAYRFTLRNEGNAVAISLVVDLVNPKVPLLRDASGKQLRSPGGVLPLTRRGALGLGDSFEITANLEAANVSPFMIRVVYVNIYGQRFDVRQPFERSRDGFAGRALDVEFYVDGHRVAGEGMIPRQAFEPPEYPSS